MDYQSSGGTLTFAAGETSHVISVATTEDSDVESDEVFYAFLVSSVGATIADDQGIGTITDDDTPQTFSVSAMGLLEPADPGQTSTASVTVTLSAPSSNPITLSISTSTDGIEHPASGADFSVGENSITFLPNETSVTFDVIAAGDLIDEYDESFNLIVSADGHGTVSTVVTISDEDLAPTLTAWGWFDAEGQNVDVAITASHPTDKDHDVKLLLKGIVEDENLTAEKGLDFTDVTARWRSEDGSGFGSGQSLAKMLTVPLVADDLDEGFEKFLVTAEVIEGDFAANDGGFAHIAGIDLRGDLDQDGDRDADDNEIEDDTALLVPIGDQGVPISVIKGDWASLQSQLEEYNEELTIAFTTDDESAFLLTGGPDPSATTIAWGEKIPLAAVLSELYVVANSAAEATITATVYHGSGSYAEDTLKVQGDGFYNDAPVITNLHLTIDTHTPNDKITDYPSITWTMTDGIESDYYEIEFDFDGDGEWDYWVTSDANETLEQDLRDFIARGVHTVSVRALEYTNDDTLLESAWESITFTNTLNSLPTAVDDETSVANEGPQTQWEIRVLENDSDRDGDNISLDSVDSPSNGTVALKPGDNSVVLYTPGVDFYGFDQFLYTIIDDFGGQESGTVTVTVSIPEMVVNTVSISSLPQDERTDILRNAAVDILGQQVGTEFANRHGLNAIERLVQIYSWGWRVRFEGVRLPDLGEHIYTPDRDIRAPVTRYGTQNHEYPLTLAEKVDSLNDLIHYNEVTHFGIGFDEGESSVVGAFTNEFFAHPGTRVAGGVLIVGLAVATGPAGWTAAASVGSWAGLSNATIAVGMAWGTIRGGDQIIQGVGEWTGAYEEGDRTWVESAIDHFTESEHKTDDILLFWADVSITVLELGNGGILLLKGQRALDNVPVVKQARSYCFTRDTLVDAADGPRPIGAIASGDQVYAMDFETGQRTLRRVKERIDSVYQGQLITIETESGLINATPGHPFWVVSGRDLEARPKCSELALDEDQDLSLIGRWVNSHDLLDGDTLYDRDGEHQAVIRVTQLATPGIPVSNLSIDGLHNYCVGNSGFLVHNVALCQGDIDRYVAEVVTENKTLDDVLQPLIDTGVDRVSLVEIIERAGRTPSDEILDAIASIHKGPFPNLLPGELADDLARAASVNANPIRFADEGFEDAVNSGTIKFVVTELDEVLISPHTVNGVEIAHSVLSNGRPVLAAGQADISASAGKFFGIGITNHSGHFKPSLESLEIAREAFRKLGIVFP